ncbi:MAG: hypothetical protein L0Z55_03700 [Planctomycetes bacterium]|nr:hypothetical protein [Planctomycetota bacterium]
MLRTWISTLIALCICLAAAIPPACAQAPPAEKKAPPEAGAGAAAGKDKPAGTTPGAPGQPPAKEGPAAPQPGEPKAPAAPVQVRDPLAVAVIDRYIEAIGGREAHAAIRDKKLVWVLKKLAPTGVTETSMVRYMKGPYMLREEWDMPGMGLLPNNGRLKTIQVFDGTTAWVKMFIADAPVDKLTGPTLHQFIYDKFIDDFFFHWEEDGYSVRHVGEDVVEDTPVAVIAVNPFTSKDQTRYAFAKDTGLLVQREFRTDERAPGGAVSRRAVFGGYNTIRFKADDKQHAIKMPTTERVFEEGDLSVEREYTSIQINMGIEDSLFARPEGPDFSESERGRSPGSGGGKATSRPATQPKQGAGTHGGAGAHGEKKEPTTKPAGGN